MVLPNGLDRMESLFRRKTWQSLPARIIPGLRNGIQEWGRLKLQPRHLLPLARNQLGVIRKAPGKDIHQGDPPMVRREKELSTKGH